MTSPGKLTSRFRVGRFTCVLAANITGDLGLTCEWEPKIQKRLSPDAIAAYRAGRDAFFAQLGEARLAGNRRHAAACGYTGKHQ